MSGDDERVSRLTESWKNDVQHMQKGLLATHVQPALWVYAKDLLSDYPDNAGAAPILADVYAVPEYKDSMVGHYVGAVAVKLGTSGTSIQSALGAIDAGLDCHMVFAALRRAFEGLCKAYWLLDPKCSRDDKMLRLASLVCHEAKDTTNTWSMNHEIKTNLEKDRQRLISAVGKPIFYSRKLGQKAYQRDLDGRYSDFEWNIMCDMTHENSVFDSIMQRQAESYVERMDRAQIEMAAFTIGMMSNISTAVLALAEQPETKLREVAATLHPLYEEAKQLVTLERGSHNHHDGPDDAPFPIEEKREGMADDMSYLSRVIHPPPAEAEPVSMRGLIMGAEMVGKPWQGASFVVVLGIMAADGVLEEHEGAGIEVGGFGGVIGPEQIAAGRSVWDAARSGEEPDPRVARRMAVESLSGTDAPAAKEHIDWCDMLIERGQA